MGGIRWGGALVALVMVATSTQSVASAAVPTVSVTPQRNIVDGQPLDIAVSGAAIGTFVSAAVCTTATPRACAGPGAHAYLDATVFHLTLRATRIMPGGIDCAHAACAAAYSLQHHDNVRRGAVPVTFDPNSPIQPTPAFTVVPGHALFDGQRVEVRADGLQPGAFYNVSLCTTRRVSSTCDNQLGHGSADADGHLRIAARPPRLVRGPHGNADCARVQCYVVLNGDSEVAIAVDFDRGAPLAASPYPAQAPCVAWPTNGWPTGPIPVGVDGAAVDALGRSMGNDSVVVIHGGKLVYEHYADWSGPDVSEPSFSVSKSFTATIIGELVQQGRLSLDARAPISEWAAASDPRHVITLRNIMNMSSGLQWDETYGSPTSDVDLLPFQPNAAAFVIAKPLAFTPGSEFHYSTGDTQVLGEIIRRTAGVSGSTYLQYLHEHLFDPLGINPANPLFDPSGGWLAGVMTATTTRNFAKLGLLYLRGGVWENRQFLARRWVDFVHTPIPTAPNYGAQFWVNPDGSFSMVGLLGQEVRIVPDLDLIVAVNNGRGGVDQMVDLFRHAEPERCGAPGVGARPDSAATHRGTAVTIPVLRNDLGAPIGLSPGSLTVATVPAHGRATAVGGQIRYMPVDGYSGSDTLTYVVCLRDRTACAEARVTIAVS